MEHKYVNTLYTYTYTNICTPLHVRSTGQPELEFDSKLRKVVIKKKKKNWYACFNVSWKEFPAYGFCRKRIPDDEIVNFILRNRYNRIYILWIFRHLLVNDRIRRGFNKRDIIKVKLKLTTINLEKNECRRYSVCTKRRRIKIYI